MAKEDNSLVNQVYTSIKKGIDEGKYKPNDKLPSENMLCEQYNVSRITIRSVISKLSAIGVVETRKGFGTIVKLEKPKSKQKLKNNFEYSEFERVEILQYLHVLERTAIKLAIKNFDENDLQELKKYRSKLDNLFEEFLGHEEDIDKAKLSSYEYDFMMFILSKADNKLIELNLRGLYKFMYIENNDYCMSAYSYYKELFVAIKTDDSKSIKKLEKRKIMELLQED